MRILAQRKTPSAKGCNGLSISFKIVIVAGVKHMLSAATTINKTTRNMINLVSQPR